MREKELGEVTRKRERKGGLRETFSSAVILSESGLFSSMSEESKQSQSTLHETSKSVARGMKRLSIYTILTTSNNEAGFSPLSVSFQPFFFWVPFLFWRGAFASHVARYWVSQHGSQVHVG